LSWPRNIPIDGEPADVVSVVNNYSSWLDESDVPKLFVNAEPGGHRPQPHPRPHPLVAEPHRDQQNISSLL
jgi:hypothetical protein